MEVVVKPRSVRLPIGDEQYIEVKRRLNTGERQDFFDAISLPARAGQIPNVKSSSVVVEKVQAYLLRWSLTDGGQPVPMSTDMPKEERISILRSLDPDLFDQIRTAINQHEDAIDLEIAEAKKSTGIAIESPAISRLPDGATGATNGSESLTRKSTRSSSKNSTPKPNDNPIPN